MSAPPIFAFQAASTPGRLIDELEKFLVYWLGPRRPEYGESEPALRGQRLPEPLRLYAFAGGWTCEDERGRTMRVFNTGEGLLPLEQLERTRFARWSSLTNARAIGRARRGARGPTRPSGSRTTAAWTSTDGGGSIARCRDSS